MSVRGQEDRDTATVGMRTAAVRCIWERGDGMVEHRASICVRNLVSKCLTATRYALDAISVVGNWCCGVRMITLVIPARRLWVHNVRRSDHLARRRPVKPELECGREDEDVEAIVAESGTTGLPEAREGPRRV
eukprot:ctg_639.g275